MNSPFTKFSKSRLVRILRAVVIGYGLVLIIMWSLQRSLLYHPRTSVPLTLDAHPRIAELYPHASNVTIETGDGERIGAWLLTHDRHSAAGDDELNGLRPVSAATSLGATRRRLVLFLHGNGGDRAHRLGWYQMFHRLEADVLAIDYRGYGDSTGQPSEAGLIEDAQSAWRFATNDLGYASDQIVVFGVSLGGGVAVQLASRVSEAGEVPQGLVVVATFSSVTDVAAGRYPFLPVRWILSDHFDSAARISQVKCPILQFHGDQDTIVPYQYGQKLFASIQPPRGIAQPRFVTLPEAGHNDLIRTAGPRIESELSDFFAERH